MAAAKGVWGLDMGRCALKAVKLRSQNNLPEVIAFDIVEHNQILSQPELAPEQVAEVIQESLDTFLGRNTTQGDVLCTGVPGQQTFSRFTKLPPVEEKKIPDIVNFEAGQQIPFDIDEVVWDWQTFREEDSPDVEVGIFAMKKELVTQNLVPFTTAQLEPTVVQSVPLALYNFLRFDQVLSEKATILIDIGTVNTDLVVAAGESVWTRSIPLGGNSFTDALVKAFKLSFNKAENLKRTAVTSKYARQIFQAMRPVFADLVAEVQRSIGFYTSTHREVEMGRVIGVGNAFKLPGLQKYLQQNLQLEVERLGEFKRLNVAPTLKAPQFSEHVLSYPVAYGLALQGLSMSAITSNMLPMEIARSVIWRRKRPFFAAAAACAVLAAGAMWARYSMDNSALARNIGTVRGTSVPKVSVERAYSAMANPQSEIPETLAPRQYVVEWLGVAEALSNELGSTRGQGTTEQKKVEQITELLGKREVVPKILAWVTECLPTPPAPFTRAADANTLREEIQSMRQRGQLLPRAQRTQILIEELSLQYTDDIHAVASERFGESRRGSRGATAPGFVIKLKGSTPNSAGQTFVAQQFGRKLQERGTEPGLGFHWVGEEYKWRQKRGTGVRTAARAPPRAQSPWAGPGSGPGGGRQPGADPAPEAGMTDPVTGESMAEDWLFEMEVRVRLGSAPKKKPE